MLARIVVLFHPISTSVVVVAECSTEGVRRSEGEM